MPADQRGSVYQTKTAGIGIRWRDEDGTPHRRSGFDGKREARKWLRQHLDGGERTAPLTFSELVELYLERHAASVRPRTIVTLRERLVHATRTFGDIDLADLERMSGEIASWQARLPERRRYGIVQALRQALGAAVRWGYMRQNPASAAGRNRQPSPRTVRVYSRDELDRLAAELAPAYASLPAFAAATGLRPDEWQALERRDLDRRAGHVNVVRTVSDGEVVELGKTSGARRQVPLSRRALIALDAIPARIDTPLLWPAPNGGLLNLDNWRRRSWAPAIEAAGIERPARIYDLRSTFASDALAAGVPIFTLARIMGTSVRMVERHYGALLDRAGAGISGLLDLLDAERDAECVTAASR